MSYEVNSLITEIVGGIQQSYFFQRWETKLNWINRSVIIIMKFKENYIPNLKK